MKNRNDLLVIFIIFMMSSFSIACAQKPSYEGVDTTHRKIINTIPIDFKCVETYYHKQKKNSLIGFYTSFKQLKKNECAKYNCIDFKKYNLITFQSSSGGCKQPIVKYSLFNTGKNDTFLKITITQIGVCKLLNHVIFYCLVLKDQCRLEPKVCIIRKEIEDKKL